MSTTLILDAPRQLRIESRPIGVPGPGEIRVRIAYGGICGSDLHYFLLGGFGKVRMRGPMVLGHEICGTVEAVGEGVDAGRIGQSVAVNPSLACGTCEECRAGAPRFCTDMRFMGSAMRNPPIEGGFREHVVCRAEQGVPFASDALEEAAMAEPLAVCLHAVGQAPDLSGKRVLITGFGPIGALCLLAARHAGAAEIVVTDVAEASLDLARRIGADQALESSRPGALDAQTAGRGRIDVSFECSAHPSAIADVIAATRPRGTIVQVGMLGAETTAPLTHVVTKELNFRGSFRFDAEFARAVDLIATRGIDVRPLISARFRLADADSGFALAQDRSRAMKVLFDLTT
ncbi:L-idonate 5-dehydrogenase [Jiella pelagia]|uniref:L-idonate 5-dehydrogenase n=1 Tax=Jiella pelagia TaxID=2986949 RepID=A0ABY7BU13_9HYPH|nr:L-idonate 5-dehydrogenase [Jiella pelagia]WAP66776.1 L-idonate 5-dehydrogenase [Jiella pelagia]